MQLLPNILRAATQDLIYLGALLGVLVSVYSIMGNVLFGHSIEAFESFVSSLETCFELALGGDVDFGYLRSEFVDVPVARENHFFHLIPIWALPFVYKWSFVIFMSVILINIFIAIVTNAYSEVKKQLEEEQERVLQQQQQQQNASPKNVFSRMTKNFSKLVDSLKTQ